MKEIRWAYVVLAIAAGTAIYLAMIIASDVDRFVSASSDFDWIYVVPVITLVTANYLLRSERWHRYIQEIGLGLNRRQSYWTFLAGLSMSVTPGKVGEALKGVLLKMQNGAPVERGIGVVFVERITDILGVMILIALGAFAYPYGLLSFAVFAVAIVVAITVVTSKSLMGRIVAWLRSHRRFRRIGDALDAPLMDARTLLRGANLARGTAISSVAWACEGLAFYLILTGMSEDVDVLRAVFVYSFSSVIGAISMLPGGMGTTEGTMIGLLLIGGTSSSVASFVVILTRVCTLWYAVAIGVVFLGLFRHSRKNQEVQNHATPD